MNSRVLVVVPAWNEEASISNVVNDLVRHSFDVLVVDDGSTDHTYSQAQQAGATVVRLPFNLGVGAALRCGFKFAVQNGYQIVIQCDADGQHPVEHISDLLQTLHATNADMVIGSRFKTNDESIMKVSQIRRIAMWVLSFAATTAAKTKITDSTSGFRAIRAPLLNQLSMNMPAYYLGDTFEVIVAAGRAGYSIVEIPAPIKERTHGVSTASTVQAIRMTIKAMLVALFGIHCRLEKENSDPISIGIF
jgi:glycosyltransferase involved in cell wall biosynthesis